MLNQTLLIVDADTLIRSSLKAFLENHNYKVCEAGTLEDAVKHDLSAYAAIVCDDQLIDILNQSSDTPVIVTSAQASLRSAVSAMKLGAADYLAKPYDMNELASTIESLTEHLNIQPAIKLLGSCRGIESLKDHLDKVAPTDSTVLIEGESGTGKELVARKIHSLSNRADRQMISLNCAAIPTQQIESELFGYESGSVTDVNNQKSGLVEAADGTTLFLDEIGELPMDAQARLLRVIEDGELRRVGSIETKRVSIRLIASTHRNLQTLTEQGAFREDLYFRLNVVRFKLPPLRERGDDVVALAKHFLASASEKYGKAKLKFGEHAIKCIRRHHWPGNVRELENAIERAVILSDRKTIAADLLAIEPQTSAQHPHLNEEASNVSLQNYFVKFVLENQDRMTETEIAEKLGISRKALWQRRQRLGIPRERGKSI